MSSETKKSFIDRLALIQAKEGLSNVAFARRCGLNTQDIQRYLTGNATPSIDKLAKISTAFGKSTDWLLGLSDTNQCNASEQFAHKFAQVLEMATQFCVKATDLDSDAKKLKSALEKMF